MEENTQNKDLNSHVHSKLLKNTERSRKKKTRNSDLETIQYVHVELGIN